MKMMWVRELALMSILLHVVVPGSIAPCKILSNQAICNEDEPLELNVWVDIHVAYHLNSHHEEDVFISRNLFQKLNVLLEQCKEQPESLCRMSIPRNARLIKFHLEKDNQGAFKIMGVYVKQREADEKDESLQITFLLKNTNQRTARSNNIKRPANNFQRIKTTPKGLVVIGVIYPTKKSVTKSLGIITPTKKPRLFMNKQVKHIFMKVPKDSKGDLNSLVKKVINGFNSVSKQMV